MIFNGEVSTRNQDKKCKIILSTFILCKSMGSRSEVRPLRPSYSHNNYQQCYNNLFQNCKSEKMYKNFLFVKLYDWFYKNSLFNHISEYTVKVLRNRSRLMLFKHSWLIAKMLMKHQSTWKHDLPGHFQFKH